MRCPTCYFENPPDTHFCGKCGTQLLMPEETVPLPKKPHKKPEMELTRGVTFAGRYEIVEELGRGGMGKVFRVVDTKIDEEIALKILKAEIAADETTIERFRNELKVARKISHKHVCRMYHFEEEEGIHYITMEYVPGEDLKSFIRRVGKLPVEKSLLITKQICEGLSEAHNLGVVHRDLKPQNIMIDREGKVRIMDFGIARLLRMEGITATGIIIGTPEYMSPEQVEGEDTDERSDIYSLGVILFEMVTGKVPFGGDSAFSVAMKHKTELPPHPRAINDKLPDDLSEVNLKCLEKAREERYQSIEELFSDLTNIEKGIPTTLIRREVYTPPPFIAREEEPKEVEVPVFVSRKNELAKLSQFLDITLTGQGRVVFISGEAGTGKTALVSEFARQAQVTHSDLIVSHGSCNAHTGMGDPYLPFREMMGLLTGDVESKWAAGAISREYATRLWNLLPISAQALVDVGPGLIDTFVGGEALVSRTAGFTPEKTDWMERMERLVERKAMGRTVSNLQQSDLFEQYTRVLHALARKRPLLLVVDALQWADAGSIQLLFHMGQRLEGNRILVIGCYRPDEVALGRAGERHPLESVINEFKKKFGEFEVELGQAEDRQFISEFLDSEPNRLSPKFRDTLFEHTKGHPLFTIELLRGMQEQGIIVKDEEGRWIEGPDLDWETMPARVEAVVRERINRLPQKLREALTLASVEGEDFTAEVLARVQKIDGHEMIRMLSSELDKRHRLVKAQGIRQMNGQRLSLYRFQHNIFQRYLYNSLDEVERAYKHEQVGNELETLYGDQVGQIAVQLARHFKLAGKASKTIDYLEKAAEQALRGYAYKEAISFLEDAMELDMHTPPGRSPEKRAHWELQIGEACLGTGRVAESSAHMQNAIALLDRPVPTGGFRLIAGLLKQVMTQMIHLLWSSRFVGRSKEMSGSLLEVARIYEHLAEICYLTQEKFVAIYSGLRALNLAERAGPSPELARNYAHLCLGAGVVSLHGLAKNYGRKALEIAQMVDPHSTSGYTLMTTAVYRSGVGGWKRVEDDLYRAIEIFQSIGDWRRWELCVSMQGLMAYFRGDFKRAVKKFETVAERAQKRGDVVNQCYGLVGRASCLLRLGRIDEAVDSLATVDFGTLSDENRFEKLCGYAILGRARLIQNRFQLAQEAAEIALQISAQSDPRYASLRAYPCVTEVFLTLWEDCSSKEPERRKLLAELARQACKALNKYAKVFPIGQSSALLWQGLCDWLAGKPNRAWKAWRNSLDAAVKFEMPYDEGLAHYEIGRHAKEQERKEHLSSAREIFTKLDAKYDLARIEALLKEK